MRISNEAKSKFCLTSILRVSIVKNSFVKPCESYFWFLADFDRLELKKEIVIQLFKNAHD